MKLVSLYRWGLRLLPLLLISSFWGTGDLVAATVAPPATQSSLPPGQAFDLQGWKLQIPGPLEVKDQALRRYSSGYFFLNAEREMCFSLDAAEKGTTPNTKYVRSELRHLQDWTVEGVHTLSGEVRVVSSLKPSKVTVLQIHGITPEGDNAPPLLRVALNDGDLYAVMKTDAAGSKTESSLLKRKVGAGYVSVTVHVDHGILSVAVDGEKKVSRDVSAWKFANYFKAGCYPQATEGNVQVFFRKLSVE